MAERSERSHRISFRTNPAYSNSNISQASPRTRSPAGCVRPRSYQENLRMDLPGLLTWVAFASEPGRNGGSGASVLGVGFLGHRSSRQRVGTRGFVLGCPVLRERRGLVTLDVVTAFWDSSVRFRLDIGCGSPFSSSYITTLFKVSFSGLLVRYGSNEAPKLGQRELCPTIMPLWARGLLLLHVHYYSNRSSI